tara:strand:- start:2486 stop:3988 length:1503 start_codon:yes stop_codon:yes gene_type:complete
MPPILENRCSGILLHISSLHSDYGIGDFGPSAFRFVDFLKDSGQKIWQILPINPTSVGNSPYSSPSAFAFNPFFISPDFMARDGFINECDLHPIPDFPAGSVDYQKVADYKNKLLDKGYVQFKVSGENDMYLQFCADNSWWLENYALFMALKDQFGGCPWNEWPEVFRYRLDDAMNSLSDDVGERVRKEKFIQFLLFQQWRELKKYCQERDIFIFGDISFYVNYDSADVWSNPEIFKLDHDRQPYVVAGVPPDNFSETGQRWGNPVYNWDVLRDTKFKWWVDRIRFNLSYFDLVRIDHFRGFAAAWEIPVDEPTAEKGQWQETPGHELFSLLVDQFKSLPIVAEDLGYITPDVKFLMEAFGFPGMKPLIFAFEGDFENTPYAPPNHIKNCVAYTGTHDCNTIRGWFDNEISQEAREKLEAFLGRQVSSVTVSDEMIQLSMMSPANTAILPMQDVLNLGKEGRLNYPGTPEGNWEWRLSEGDWPGDLADKLNELTRKFGRG